MQKIYFVEDDDNIRDMVIYALSSAGFEAEGFADGESFWRAAERASPSLLLLDIMLPGINGLEVLRRFRRENQTPVIMLTARDAVMDKVTGLDMGADDYITKPFDIEELLARIRVALRKKVQSESTENSILKSGALTLDLKRHTADYDGNVIELTNREFMLLQILLENKYIVLTRSALLEHVWGYQYMGETNVVDVYIRYLRSKIDDAFKIKLIHTVRGVGYVLKDAET